VPLRRTVLRIATRRTASLRVRLLIALTTVALVALVIADVVTYEQLHSFLYNQLDQSLSAEDSPIGAALFPPQGPAHAGGFGVGFGGPPAGGFDRPLGSPTGGSGCGLATPILQHLASGTFIQIRAGSTVLTTCTTPSSGVDEPRLPAHFPGFSATSSADGSPTAYFSAPSRVSGGSPFRVLVANLVGEQCSPGRPPLYSACAPGRNASGFVVVVAQPLSAIDGTLGRLLDVELAVTAAALAAALLIGWWLVRIGLRPLRAVEATAAAIAAGEMDQRVPGAEANTEVGRLARALNVMLGRIQSAFGQRDATEAELRESEGRMRQFVADASHELRTPLAAISAYAELFERGASRRADDLERVMTGIATEAGRMGHLVEDLLLLARLDEGRPLERRPVELVALAGEAAQTARTVAPGWPVMLAARQPVEVTGDGPRLRQVLDNLLSNVRDHTPAGTTTELAIAREGDVAVITCSDDGPGLDADSARRAFERFFRADPSRSRQHGGAGLGLSIVESIVRAHGGTVAAEARPGGGVTFRVRLPVDGATAVAHPTDDARPPGTT
jgi:two-component system, OmpR family, sensor kinase